MILRKGLAMVGRTKVPPTSSRQGRQHPRGHHAEGRPPKGPCERGVARIPRGWTLVAARGRQRNPRPRLQPPGSPWIGSCRQSSCWAPSSCSDMPSLRRLQQGTHASNSARMPARPSVLLLVGPSAHRAAESSELGGLSGHPRLPFSLDIPTPLTPPNRRICLHLFQNILLLHHSCMPPRPQARCW